MSIKIIEGKEAQNLDSKTKWDLLSPYITQYGSGSLSYSTLQQNLEYFIDDNLGYVAYSTIHHPIFAPSRRILVLSNPITDPKNYEELIKKFLSKRPNTIFLQTDQEVSNILSDRNFYINCMGIESMININEFNLRGEKKQIIRTSRNSAIKQGITFKEIDETIDQEKLKQISEDWLLSRKLSDKEIWFFARPAIFNKERDVRKFISENAQNEALGFVFFDPLYKDNKIIGYSPSVIRFNKKFRQGINDYMLTEGINIFKKEKSEIINLGLSPFYNINLNEIRNSSIFTNQIFNFFYNYGNDLYNFKNLGFHKNRYGGSERGVYFCTRDKYPLRDIYISFKNSKMIQNPWDLLKKIFRINPKN